MIRDGTRFPFYKDLFSLMLHPNMRDIPEAVPGQDGGTPQRGGWWHRGRAQRRRGADPAVPGAAAGLLLGHSHQSAVSFAVPVVLAEQARVRRPLSRRGPAPHFFFHRFSVATVISVLPESVHADGCAASREGNTAGHDGPTTTGAASGPARHLEGGGVSTRLLFLPGPLHAGKSVCPQLVSGAPLTLVNYGENKPLKVRFLLKSIG